jgi:hypothetical protein
VSTNKDTERTITLNITPPDAVIKLHDPMYATVSASTSSFPRDTHNVHINVKDDEVRMHFEHAFITLSLADWQRVVAGVAGIVDAEVSA